MERIPIRIYRLVDYGENSEFEGAALHINEWEFVQNKTDEDIDSSGANFAQNIVGVIELTSENIFGSTFVGTNSFVVYNSVNGNGVKDDDGNVISIFYIVFEGEKYYLRRKQGNVNENDIIPNVFEFYVNPERITPTHGKLITETRTRAGWDIQHWGEKLTEIRVEGKTGGLNKVVKEPGTVTNVATLDITQSIAWKRLSQLKVLYDADHQEVLGGGKLLKLGFNYYDKFYIGYFTEFTGPTADAEKPYLMTYSFTFKVEEEIPLSLVNSIGV
jgi:hypothetical protein